MAWAKGITRITILPDLGNTPARTNRETGEMQLSEKHIKKMPANYLFFVMLHEMGHVVLQTNNEETADGWAFQQYADRGHSLTDSVLALTRILNNDNPEHHWRMYLELQRAEAYDKLHNGNTKFN